MLTNGGEQASLLVLRGTGKGWADVVTWINIIGQKKEKELFNWLKLTWPQDTVLRLSCGRVLPREREIREEKQYWTGLEM